MDESGEGYEETLSEAKQKTEQVFSTINKDWGKKQTFLILIQGSEE